MYANTELLYHSLNVNDIKQTEYNYDIPISICKDCL